MWFSFRITEDVSKINDDKKQLDNDKEQIEETPKLESNEKSVAIFSKLSKRNNELIPNTIHFHEDIKDLIWFADSPLLNIDPKQFIKTMSCSGFKLEYSYSGLSEPSMIFTKLPIEFPKDFSQVDLPDYFPTYIGFDPLQKGLYIKFLENPYNTEIYIGYVFLLYYGLERHLFLGDWEKAVDVILKLRKCHKNNSFQLYSATALILTAIYREKGEIALKVISQLDSNDFLPVTEYFLCASSFNLHITSRELMYYSDWLGFHNKRYIKNQTELFSKTLIDFIQSQFNRDYLLVSDILTDTDIRSMETQETKLYANTSLSNIQIQIPYLSENEKLRTFVCSLLQKTHDFVKNYLAEQRKTCKQI